MPPDVYKARQQKLIDDIVRYARYQTDQEFKEHNIKKKWDIKDLHSRDEDGNVHFIDPDKGTELPTRLDAQNWINVMNDQVNETYQMKVKDTSMKMVQNARPMFELLQFGPTYDAMDQDTKDMFEDIIAPYSLRDASGQVYGFSCNLNAAHEQAKRLVNRVRSMQKPAQQQAAPMQAKTPAMDMKTGSGSSTDDGEPKTLEEAMRRLNASKKEKKNG